MPVPDFQMLMLPVLKALSGGRETRLSEVRETVASAERLTAEDLQELLSSIDEKGTVPFSRPSGRVMRL